jgi:hypothetical protein
MASAAADTGTPDILPLAGRRAVTAGTDVNDLGRREGQGLFALTVPRQHGAWTSLLSAYVLGTGTGGRFGIASVLLLGAVLAAFLGRQAALLAFKRPAGTPGRAGLVLWTAVYAAAFLSAGVLLLSAWDLGYLLHLGATAFVLLAVTMALERRRRAFTPIAEGAGFLGLSLVAPAAEYAASGAFTVRTAAVGLMCAAFFIGSMIHVRFLLRNRPETLQTLRGRAKAGAVSVIYHLHIYGFALSAASAGLLPPLAPLAFAPATARALWSIAHGRRGPVPVRSVGWQEVANTLLFVGLAVLAFRLPA